MRNILTGAVVCASLAAATAVLFGQAPLGQPQPAKLEFEVASIKPAPPLDPVAMQQGKMRIGMKIETGRVDIGGMPVSALLPQVFRVKPYQIIGQTLTAAAILNSERWDIQAKIPDGVSQDQVPEMLLTLLQDRFKLAYHRENKEMPVYALIVGKTGSKLKDVSAETDAPLPDDPKSQVLDTGNGQVRISQTTGAGGRGGSAMISSPQYGNMKMLMGPDNTMHLEASKMTMAGLTELLTSFVDRPVLDMTEMKGSYQVSLEISTEELMTMVRAQGLAGPGAPGAGAAGAGPATASDPSGGAIFSAVQKLGLKLDARKAPVETIVIDHLDKAPTEN